MSDYYLLVGNRGENKIQIYRFEHAVDSIYLTKDELVWESPEVEFMTEVKPVTYNGKKAILSTTGNGVVIFELSSEKSILFHKEIVGYDTNIHSAHPLPGGNVIFADSFGWLGILKCENAEVNQSSESTTWYPLSHAHAIAFDEVRNKLYVGGHMEIKKFSYSIDEGTLSEEAIYDISHYYLRCREYNECNEDHNWADGVHDIYQVNGRGQGVYFISTGERVFLFDTTSKEGMKDGKVFLHHVKPFYEIDSKKSQEIASVSIKEKIILKKGGVKSISGFIKRGEYFVLAHSAPWFSPDVNYSYNGTQLIYAASRDDVLDFDLTKRKKITFSPDLNMKFYKARLLDKNWMPLDIVNVSTDMLDG